MKKLVYLLLALPGFVFGQMQTPKLSPQGSFKQSVGLTEIEVSYSRPSLRGRTFFEIEKAGELWRTGANENTIFQTSTDLYFGKDTLKAGKYALFTRPNTTQTTLYFYKNTENWGVPDEWKEEWVALSLNVMHKPVNGKVETFVIELNNLQIDGATLKMAWDNWQVETAFTTPTKKQVAQSIDKTLAGPTAMDYYRAADYYLGINEELPKALEYINRSVEMADPSYWILRKKALIEAANGKTKEAIATAQLSSEKAKAAGNMRYVEMNDASIKEWSGKQKK